jgi:hypothetical protein
VCGRAEEFTVSEPEKSEFALMLPKLLPRALLWAEAQSRNICLLRGEPLVPAGVTLAKTVGVTHPDRIRLWVVPQIPAPEDPDLRRFALEQNLIGPNTHGLTVGYGIFILEGHLSARLLSHECRHVHQVEQAGSLTAFLSVYLQQIADHGYEHAPYELDARTHERDPPPAEIL